MSRAVGVFTVDDDITPSQLAAVQTVAAAIPSSVAAADGQGVHRVQFTNRPARVPSWAWEFTPSAAGSWISPTIQGKPPITHSLTDQWLYVIAHGYFHGFDYRRLNPTKRKQITQLMPGIASTPWKGGHYASDFSNRPAEAAADSFARLCGFGTGILTTFYHGRLPASSYGQLVAIMTGGAASAGAPLPGPTPELVPAFGPQSVNLRASPNLAAPVIRRVGSGGRIQTGRGRIGSAWGPLPDGSRGSLWLEVVTLDGTPLVPPLWVAAGLVQLPGSPTTPAPTTPPATAGRSR